jgi:hypothetical protein
MLLAGLQRKKNRHEKGNYEKYAALELSQLSRRVETELSLLPVYSFNAPEVYRQFFVWIPHSLSACW